MSEKLGENSEDEQIDITKLLLQIFLLFKKYLKLLIVCCLIGLLGALGVFFLKTPVYESHMTINSGMLDYASGNTLISTLKRLIDERNYKEMSNKIHLDIDKVTKIKSLDISNIYKSDEEEKIKLLQISVKTEDNSLLSELQDGIIKYLEENPYVKKRVDLRKENINATINFLQSEMDQINSLKTRIAEGGIFKDNANNLMLFDPVSVYKELILLFEQKLKLEENLQLVENFQVIQGFTPFRKPSEPKLVTNLVLGLVIGSIFGFFIISYLEMKGYMKILRDENEN